MASSRFRSAVYISAAVVTAALTQLAPAANAASPPTNLCALHLQKQLAALRATGCQGSTGTWATPKIVGDGATWHSALGPNASIQLNVTFGETQTAFYAEGENNGTAGGAPVKFGSGSRSEVSSFDAAMSLYVHGVGIWVRVARQPPDKAGTQATAVNRALLAPMLALAKAVSAQA